MCPPRVQTEYVSRAAPASDGHMWVSQGGCAERDGACSCDLNYKADQVACSIGMVLTTALACPVLTVHTCAATCLDAQCSSRGTCVTAATRAANTLDAYGNLAGAYYSDWDANIVRGRRLRAPWDELRSWDVGAHRDTRAIAPEATWVPMSGCSPNRSDRRAMAAVRTTTVASTVPHSCRASQMLAHTGMILKHGTK